MLKNYIVLFFRNFMRQKGYTLINIIGLSIGITCSVIIALFVVHELSYDKMHHQSSNIYRVTVHGKMMGSEFNMIYSAPPMAAAIKSDVPGVEQICRIGRYGAWLVANGDKKFNEDDFLFADSTFFDVFDFKLIKGDRKTALLKPKSIVLSENAVKRYFGNEAPMGKLLKIETDTTFYEVTGIIENLPSNSHFHFDLLGSLLTLKIDKETSWVSHNLATYLVVNKNIKINELVENLNKLIPKYMGPQLMQILGASIEELSKKGNKIGYKVQSLESIHLHSNLQGEFDANSDILYIYIFSIIAIFIVFIACINYMNLATARSAGRAKEIGLRKVMGSNKQQLVYQFIAESIFVTLIAFFISIAMVEILLPVFNNSLNINLSINYLTDWKIIPSLIGLVILIGVIAGSYPAFFLAGFKPVEVLKGKLKAGAKNKLLRSVLIIFQFSISIFILLGTFTVYSQLQFMLKKNLGFDKEQVLVIRRSDRLGKKIETFKQEILKNPAIVAVSYTNSLPGHVISNNACFLENQSASNSYIMDQAWVNFDFTKVLNLQIAEGRTFSADLQSDSTSILINETAVRYLGFKSNKEAIGKRVLYPNGDNKFKPFPIIGVIKDFNFQSLHRPISPMVLTIMPGNWEGYVLVKIRPENYKATIASIENNYKQYSDNFPFQYFFLDDDLQKAYKSEQQTEKILFIFSLLAIFVACLGLLGLVSFIAEQRTKEIGIRKTLGASIFDINILMVKEIVKLVFIAILIITPVAYYVIKNWLENFAYHIQISPLIFVLVALIIFVIAILSVSYQSIKASMSNPVEALKYE